MKIIIEYQGKTYESPISNEYTAKQLKDSMYKELDSIEKFSMELKGGGFVMLCKDALRSCVIKILDT